MGKLTSNDPSLVTIGEVDVFEFSLDKVSEADLLHFSSVLTADELARAGRFVTEELSRRFVVCRGRLRLWLGERINVPADKLRFEYEALGKPKLRLSSKPENHVHFNVSHSADRALIAFASQPVGIDVEVRTDKFRYQTIASQLLSEREMHAWNSLRESQRQDQAMRMWVCKESLLKALGLGIAEGLKKVAFSVPIPERGSFAPVWIDPILQLQLEEDSSCSKNSWLEATTWRTHMLPEISGCYAALTTMRGMERIRVRDMGV